jgi:hypothetical protein
MFVNAAETHGTEDAKTPTYRFTSSTGEKSFQYAAGAGVKSAKAIWSGVKANPRA